MNESGTIAEALAQIDGVLSVTRGWPKQTAALPCIAVGLEESGAADIRDDAAYLTRNIYSVRIFAQTMSGCDALQEAVACTMETLGYTLEHTGEIDGEIAQLKMMFYKLT